MRAVPIKTIRESTQVLELVDIPEPSRPAAAEVLAGVEYAPINMSGGMFAPVPRSRSRAICSSISEALDHRHTDPVDGDILDRVMTVVDRKPPMHGDRRALPGDDPSGYDDAAGRSGCRLR